MVKSTPRYTFQVEEAADRLTREKIALEGRLEVTEKRLEQVLRDLEESQDLVAVLLAERSFELDKVVVPEVSVPRSSAANTSSWAPFSVDAIPTEELILHRRPASRPGAWCEGHLVDDWVYCGVVVVARLFPLSLLLWKSAKPFRLKYSSGDLGTPANVWLDLKDLEAKQRAKSVQGLLFLSVNFRCSGNAMFH